MKKLLVAAGLTGVAALTGTASPARATGPQFAQLVASVCDMTTYFEGKGPGPDPLPQSDFEAKCQARTVGGALFMGRYASYDAWWHDLTHLSDFYRKMAPGKVISNAGKGTYAAITMADGYTVVFENANGDYSPAALAPLQAAGFTVSPNPPQV